MRFFRSIDEIGSDFFSFIFSRTKWSSAGLFSSFWESSTWTRTICRCFDDHWPEVLISGFVSCITFRSATITIFFALSCLLQFRAAFFKGLKFAPIELCSIFLHLFFCLLCLMKKVLIRKVSRRGVDWRKKNEWAWWSFEWKAFPQYSNFSIHRVLALVPWAFRSDCSWASWIRFRSHALGTIGCCRYFNFWEFPVSFVAAMRSSSLRHTSWRCFC